MCSHITQHDGVSICACLRGTGDSARAASPSSILHDDRLAQRPGHMRPDEAYDRVAGAAGGERNDQSDRPLRESARRRNSTGNKRQRGYA
jgi:hypothetical protein